MEFRLRLLIRITSAVIIFAAAFGAVRVDAGTLTYIYTDPQGTPLAEADISGNVTSTFEYQPYGSNYSGAGMAAGSAGPGYTGHVNDPDTSLVYMQARYYDASIGRFLSVDPIGPADGNIYNVNRFAYANNNPILNTDPDGRCTGSLFCNSGALSGAAGVAGPGYTVGSSNDGGGFTHGHQQQSQSAIAAGATLAISASETESTAVIGRSVVRAAPWLAALAISGDTARDKDSIYVYVAYTRVQPVTGQVYSGRTSGYMNQLDPLGAQKLVTQRGYGQPLLNAEGFLPGVVNAWSTNYAAVRGREQQLIDFHGGAQSMGGSSRNMINGISPGNILRTYYLNSSTEEFGGPLPNNSPSK